MTPSGEKGLASAGPLFDAAARLVGWLTGLGLAGLVTLVCTEAFLRGLFNISLGFAEELTGYLVVMLTFFGAALALRAGALFQVNFLFGRLPSATHVFVSLVFVAVALVICAIFAWKGYELMASSLTRGKFAPTVLRTSLWIPQLLLPAGFGVIGLFLGEQLMLAWRLGKETR